MLRIGIVLTITLYAFGSPAQLGPAYHDYSEVVAALDTFATNYPSLCTLDSVGHSTRDSLAIWMLKVSDNPAVDEDEAAFLFCDSGHSEEVMSAECMLDFADYLLSNYGIDPDVTRLVDDHEVYIVPNCSPDGHEVVFQGLDYYYRKTKRDNNGNGIFDYDPNPPSGPPNWTYGPDPDGVDINRNFPFNWSQGGSSDPDDQTYRGAAPFTEAEARVQDELVALYDPTIAVFLHSAIQARDDSNKAERFFYPWAWNGSTYSVDFEILKDIATQAGLLIPNQDRTGHYRGDLWWTSRKGDAKDYLYHQYGAFAYELEVGRDIHPPDTVMQRIVNDVRPGFVYLVERLDGPGVTGLVTDSLSGWPVHAEVRVLEHHDPVDMEPRMTHAVTGRYRRLLFADSSYTLEVSATDYFTKTINFTASDSITVIDVQLRPTTGVDDEPAAALPAAVVFETPRPNPFNPEVKFVFSLSEAGHVRLTVFDVLGRGVRVLAEGVFPAGRSVVRWDGLDGYGRNLPSGVYFVRLDAADKTAVQRAVLVR
jgi:murein tripeptide amidase MpaA